MSTTDFSTAELETLSLDQIASVNKEVTQHSDKDSVRDEILNDVGRLTSTISAIEKNFSEIYRQLQKVDKKKKLPDKYAPEWKKLRDEYTMLKKESQKTANNLKSQVQDFLDILTPESARGPQERRTLLSAHIEALKKFEAEGNPIDTKFTRLRQDVENFKDNLKDDVEEAIEDQQSELQKVEEKIKDLQSELDSVSSAFIKVWGDLKSKLRKLRQRSRSEDGEDSLDFLMVPAILVALAPKTAPGFLSAVFSAIGSSPQYVIKLGSLKQDLSEQVQRRDKLDHGIKSLEKIKSGFKDLDTQFDETASGLSSLNGIWHLLIIDADSLRIELEKSTWNNVNVSRVENLYRTLLSVLDKYTLEFGRAR